MTAEWLTSFLTSVVRYATPLMIATLSLILSEKTGMLNIGVEGLMSCGAFFSYACAIFFGDSPWIGVLFAIIVTALMNLLYAVTTITFRAEQAIIGMALNILCVGLGSFLYRRLFMTGGLTTKCTTFSTMKIPLLSRIPILGEALFSQSWYVYFAVALAVALWVLLKKTSVGNSIIAIGEYPKAAESLGIPVQLFRYVICLICGGLWGIAGSALSMNITGSYTDNIVSGRGYIALGLVILGKWHPRGVILGALMFGFAYILQINLQIVGISIDYNLVKTLPYVLTVAIVILSGRKRSAAPGALGVPYEKSK